MVKKNKWKEINMSGNEQVQAVETPVSRYGTVLSRAQREELKELSKEVFGASSRYAKLMSTGYHEMVTEEISEIVPGEDGKPDTERMVKVPVKTASGALQYVQKYHTADSVMAYMIQCKVILDKFKADMAKKQADEAAAKAQEEANKKTHEELSGSAV